MLGRAPKDPGSAPDYSICDHMMDILFRRIKFLQANRSPIHNGIKYHGITVDRTQMISDIENGSSGLSHIVLRPELVRGCFSDSDDQSILNILKSHNIHYAKLWKSMWKTQSAAKKPYKYRLFQHFKACVDNDYSNVNNGVFWFLYLYLAAIAAAYIL